MEQNRIAGIDVLKFILALLIVDSHVLCHDILPPPLQKYIIHPIESLAVPSFFVISSFLFFRKARYAMNQSLITYRYVRRICFLYLFWCIVWFPIIYIQKSYFHPLSLYSPLFFIRDFLWGEVFDASWFLGALIMGIPIVWLLSGLFRKDILVLITCFLVTNTLFNNNFPIKFHYLYHIISSFTNPNLTFLSGLLWIAIGYLLANKKVLSHLCLIRNEIAWLFVPVFLLLTFFLPSVPKILCVVTLFVAAYTWKLPEHPNLYQRFRTYSILFYVIHDCFKKIPKQLFGWDNGPVLFVITIIFCFLISEFIIRMKDTKGLRWLKYAY